MSDLRRSKVGSGLARQRHNLLVEGANLAATRQRASTISWYGSMQTARGGSRLFQSEEGKLGAERLARAGGAPMTLSSVVNKAWNTWVWILLNASKGYRL
jgi:hypothetical protein